MVPKPTFELRWMLLRDTVRRPWFAFAAHPTTIDKHMTVTINNARRRIDFSLWGLV
jgi:hypothetical protein